MQVSAEVRWFWKGSLPDGLESWFHRGPWPPGGGRPRVDDYLVDAGHYELGIKRRGDRAGVEIKGLVAVSDSVPAPFTARIQIWSKWISPTLTIDHLPCVPVHKTRLVRKFDTTEAVVVERRLGEDEQPIDGPPPARGCQIELTSVGAFGLAAGWWTLGFEAFDTIDGVVPGLQRTIAHIASIGRPSIDGGRALSYPAWLAEIT